MTGHLKSGWKRSGGGRLLAVALFATTASASAQGNSHATPPVGASQDEIQKFCSNIIDTARDRRYLIQRQELEKLQAGIDDRMKALEARKAEYQDWLKRRDDFLKQADNNLTNIYKNMKPDAAAAALQAVDINVAAAIMMKLSPKQSGLIFAEMKADTAAKITSILSAAGDPNTSKDGP